MGLIKFPSHITPARVTVALNRTDEVIPSPVTGVQQVQSRGNPYWRWIYEFTDLSESEREVVHAFLMRCKGSINTFKVSDPGDYAIRGSVSDWIDIFSNYGSFNVVAGSASGFVNSWFLKNTRFDHHISDEQTVQFDWRVNRGDANALTWIGDGGTAGFVGNLEAGKAYVHRIKHFQNPKEVVERFLLLVGSGTTEFSESAGPASNVESSDAITVPFFTGANVTSITANVRIDEVAGRRRSTFGFADYQLARCVLVANSEQLLSSSNIFDSVNWTAQNVNVESGWWNNDPVTGVASGGWKIYVNANVNTEHYIEQQITRNNTEDIFNATIYARESDTDFNLRVELHDGGSQFARALFNLGDGTVVSPASSGFRRFVTQIASVDALVRRCSITAELDADTDVTVRFSVVNTDSNVQFTGNGSAGVELFGAQLTKFPFPKRYIATGVGGAIVASAAPHTGSELMLSGFDPGDIVKAGQRFEVVNRFHDQSSSYFERSEFKRVTREAKAEQDGTMLLEFDPPIRNAPVEARYNNSLFAGATLHNPVIFYKPEMKARLVSGTIQYVDKPLKLTDIVFEVIEDLTV